MEIFKNGFFIGRYFLGYLERSFLNRDLFCTYVVGLPKLYSVRQFIITKHTFQRYFYQNENYNNSKFGDSLPWYLIILR
jgi:hypothetical protein